MTKYLVLIYGDEAQWAAMPPAQRAELDAAHRVFTKAAGPALLDGGELEPTAAATTVRADSARQVFPTDGPFMETKEVVGGFYLLEAADLEQVLALVAHLYEVYADHSAVEIRPVASSG